MTVTVVTGSSTGIGHATALRLARDGHTVVATMRNPSGSDLAELAAGEGLPLEVRALDVNDDDSVNTTFASVLADHGAVDVLVNNAGVSIGGTVEELSLDAFADVMNTNYFGALRCTKAVLPSMRERGNGCIVNVSSQAGRLAVPSLSAYCASKWALEGVMETLASEVAPFGIRIALIEPGAILTPIIGKGGPPPSPESPYGTVYRRFGLLAFHDFGRGSTADVVADCIAEAIAADPPRLRWLVGQGAERNISTRAAMSDEDAIRVWNADEDAQFLAAMLGDEASGN